MELNKVQILLLMAVVLTLVRIVRPLFRRLMKRRFEQEQAEHEATWRSIRAEDPKDD